MMQAQNTRSGGRFRLSRRYWLGRPLRRLANARPRLQSFFAYVAGRLSIQKCQLGRAPAIRQSPYAATENIRPRKKDTSGGAPYGDSILMGSGSAMRHEVGSTMMTLAGGVQSRKMPSKAR